MKFRIGPASGAYSEFAGEDDTLVQVELDGTATIWGNNNTATSAVVLAGVSQNVEPASCVAETFSRKGLANVAPLSTGRLSVQAIKLRKNQIVTSISFLSGTQAAVAPTAWLFSLFAPGVGGARLGQSADQTSTAWAASTLKTLALTTPYTVTATGIYYVGIHMAAGTVVSLAGIATLATVKAIAPSRGGTADTGLTTAAPATLGTITEDAIDIYAFVK